METEILTQYLDEIHQEYVWKYLEERDPVNGYRILRVPITKIMDWAEEKEYNYDWSREYVDREAEPEATKGDRLTVDYYLNNRFPENEEDREFFEEYLADLPESKKPKLQTD